MKQHKLSCYRVVLRKKKAQGTKQLEYTVPSDLFQNTYKIEGGEIFIVTDAAAKLRIHFPHALSIERLGTGATL